MTCTLCGAANPEGAAYCVGCGGSLKDQPASAPEAEGQQQERRYYQGQGATAAAPAPVPVQQQQGSHYHQGNAPEDTKPMTLGDYMITMLVSWIPVVGLILLLVWGFSAGVNENKKNYARARLIYALISLGLFVVLIAVLVPFFYVVGREFNFPVEEYFYYY